MIRLLGASRTAAEIRNPNEVFDGISDKKSLADMLSVAEKIIEQREGAFDPGDFEDRYEEALKALIDEKKTGHKPVATEAPEYTNVADLMAALRANLKARGKNKAPAKAKPAKAAANPNSKAKKSLYKTHCIGD